MIITLERGTSTDPRGVIGQLARFEGRRLLTSPFLWLATAASGALVWLAFGSVPDTLDWRSVAIAGACLPIAAVALLLAHHSASRDRWSRVGELTTVPPIERDRRMLGLAAAAWAPLLLSLLVTGFGVVLALSDDLAGSWNLAELVAGPLVVAGGHVGGVTLGRWAPNPLVAPLALVVVAGLFLADNLSFGPREIPAASPFLPWRMPYTNWVQGEPRLPLIHLLHVVGLIGIAVSLAARRWRWLIAGTAVSAAAVGLLSDLEVAGDEVVAAVQDWDAGQPRVCQDHEGVRFCAIEGYQTWIDGWADTVDGVRDLVPVTLALIEVQQTPGGLVFEDTDPTVAHVAGNWKGPESSEARSLAMQVLAPELGLPGTAGESAEMNTEAPACMARSMPLFTSDQARAVGLIVLGELAIPGAAPIDVHPGPVQFEQLELSRGEVELAHEILERSDQEVVSTLQDHWDQLLDPATGTATLAGWFELEAPEVLTESSFEAMTCTCSGGGGYQCTGRP